VRIQRVDGVIWLHRQYGQRPRQARAAQHPAAAIVSGLKRFVIPSKV
jgi:hypothetical protein